MDLKKKCGNNISIMFRKKEYIIGNKFNISTIINMSLIYTFIVMFWILFLYNTFTMKIFFFGILFYSLLLYYYLKSFFTEPGIIPRNYPKYSLNREKKENTIDSECNLFKIIDNKNRSTMPLEIDESGLKNLEKNNEEKENKIFPDFVLAESNEDLKNNEINLQNSINTGSFDNKYNLNQLKEKNVYIYSKKYKKENNEISGNIFKNIRENHKNNTLDSFIPHIFSKRPCDTCNITRPPKTSHCVICDNCIMEMDHHCFYISNCIGIRNRKFFVLFLIYGFILSVLCIITSLYHLYLIFIFDDKSNQMTKSLFKKYYIPIIISFITMIIGILILILKKESIILSSIVFIPGNILFDIIFYINKKKFFSELNIYKYHPFCLTLIYAILPMLMFVCKYLRKQLKLIGKNLSTKQYMSIKEERNKNKDNKDIYNYLDSILQKKVEIKNIISFLLKKQSKSLINE